MAGESPVAQESFPDIPPIPPAVVEAASGGRLVLFVGAGVSKLAGGPSWRKAADDAFKELNTKGLITYAEVQQLKSEHPKKKLSIAMDICEGAKETLDFRKIFSPPSQGSNIQIYRDLYSTELPIVTTNYDEGFDLLAQQNPPILGLAQAAQTATPQAAGMHATATGAVYFYKNDLTIEKLQVQGAVMHLHGSVKDPKSMVISTRQYIEHYRDDFVKTFLSELFEGDYIVLFIGYGLEEEEIIEYVTGKNPGKVVTNTKEARHFWLYPRFAFEDARFKHLSQYYLNHCNVKLVPFSIDQQGHGQLKDVITDWTGQLKTKVRAPEFLKKLKLIDEVT